MISVKQDNSQKTEQLTKKTWEDLRLSCFGSEYKMVEHFTRFMIAHVGIVSNRVIARKLEQEPKKRWKGEGKGRRGSFFPLVLTLPCNSFFFCSCPNFLDEVAQKHLLHRLVL